MDTRNEMNTYILNTKMKDKRKHAMRWKEIRAVYDLICCGMIFDAILLTFNYGQAKGYRMAKRDLRHG